MTSAVDRIRASVERLLAQGRDEGIETDGPLGRWLEGQAQALAGLADILAEQSASIGATLTRIEAAAEAEIKKLGLAIDAANQVSRQGEVTLRQAQLERFSVQDLKASLVVEHENVTLRMIKETLPLFAERLEKVLMIRERRWNRDIERCRMGTAAAIVLAIFVAGACFHRWLDADRLAAFDGCLSHSFVVDGHAYCQIPGWESEVPWATKK